jgi:hypothetical protein
VQSENAVIACLIVNCQKPSAPGTRREYRQIPPTAIITSAAHVNPAISAIHDPWIILKVNQDIEQSLIDSECSSLLAIMFACGRESGISGVWAVNSTFHVETYSMR